MRSNAKASSLTDRPAANFKSQTHTHTLTERERERDEVAKTSNCKIRRPRKCFLYINRKFLKITLLSSFVTILTFYYDLTFIIH